MIALSALLYFATAIATVLLVRVPRRAAIVLVLLPLCLTGRALFTGGVYGPIDLPYATEPLASVAEQAGVTHVANPAVSDVAAQFIPWSDALRRSIRDGEWPLWNRFELCGNPLAGAAQSAPYHPVTLLGLLLPLPDAVTFAASMMFFLAALSAFLLLRGFVDADGAVLFGAAAWMLSTHLVSFAGTAHAMSVSIMPLVLAGGRAIVRNPGWRSSTMLGAALLLLVLSGHPESALHVVALACAYVAFEFASSRKDAHAVVAAGLGAGIATLFLSAIFLLPMLDAIRQTDEYRHRETGGPRQESSSAPMMLHRLRANAMPFLEGTSGIEEHAPDVKHGWLATSYAGSMLFAPALFAVWKSRRRERWFFLGALVWGLLTGISAPGITELLAHTPLFSIAINDRMISFAALGLCALAAMGISSALLPAHGEKVPEGRMRGDSLHGPSPGLRPPSPRKRGEGRYGLPVMMIVIGIALIGAGRIAGPTLSSEYVSIGVMRAAVPLFLAAAAMFVTRRYAIAILVALLLVQRVGELGETQPTLPRRALAHAFPGLEVMRANEPFRIVAVGTLFPPNIATHYGLEDARGFEAMTLASFHDRFGLWSVPQAVWSNRVDNLDSPFLSVMNVRFAIVPAGFTAPAGWMVRASQPNYAILENTHVLPRAFSQDGRIIARAHGFHASMQRDGEVVVSNAAWNGWHAMEGNRELPIRIAHGTFLGIDLPAGEHDVELFYRPRAFVIGAWISAMTALVLIALRMRFRARS